MTTNPRLQRRADDGRRELFLAAMVDRRLHEPDAALRTAIGRDRKGKASLALYIAAIVMSFVLPGLAVAIYVAICIMAGA